MQLFALQSGNFVEWATIMGAFALGTLPVLFGVGLGTKYIKDKLTLINPLIASLLVVFWLYTVYNGTILTQALSDTGWSKTAIAQNAETELVNVWFDGSRLVPRSTTLIAGKNYKVVVMPSSDGRWCKWSMVIPGVWPHPIKSENPLKYLSMDPNHELSSLCVQAWVWGWGKLLFNNIHI